MSTIEILEKIEEVIKTVSKDIKKKKGCGSEKVGRLSQLVNAYNRLLNSPAKAVDDDYEETGK